MRRESPAQTLSQLYTGSFKMTEGLEIKNETGTFQISQNTQVFSFLRKGTVSTIARSEPNDFYDTSVYALIADFDPLTEICAISSTEYISTLFSENGKLYIGMKYINEVHNYPSVNYWIFGKSKQTSSQGIQVFDGNGTTVENLLYDSSWIPIKPYELVSVPELGLSGSGLPTQYTQTLPTGKSFAYIPMVVHSKSTRNVRELNQTGTVDQEWEILYDRRDDAAKIVGNNFYVSPSYVSWYFYFTLGQRPWNDKNFESDNNARTKYLVIDVTGL